MVARFVLLGGDTEPSGLYARLCHAFLVYLSKAIPGFTGPIFTIFSPNGRYLHECCQSSPFFSNSSRDVAMATNLVANMGQNYPPPLHLSLCHSETEWDISATMCVNSVNDGSILCEIFMKFGPVISRDDFAHL